MRGHAVGFVVSVAIIIVVYVMMFAPPFDLPTLGPMR